MKKFEKNRENVQKNFGVIESDLKSQRKNRVKNYEILLCKSDCENSEKLDHCKIIRKQYIRETFRYMF